jgi:hypothetical protein
MVWCYESGYWNACVVIAIHCAINSIDAWTVHSIGSRYAGEKHEDAYLLLKETGMSLDELESKKQQHSSLLSMKARAEYEEKLLNHRDAENARKACDRIFSWVKVRIG